MTLFFSIGTWLLWHLARDQQLQVIGLAEFTINQPLDKLKWTIPRIPRLTSSGVKPVHAGYVGDGLAKTSLSRESLAEWCLNELKVGQWIGKAPFLSNS